MKYVLIPIVKIYQYLISPLFSGNGCGCRFMPTCSHYAAEALEKHGAINGIKLTAKRLLKCHPFGSDGYDPVPEKNNKL